MDQLFSLLPPAAWVAFCLGMAAVYIRYWPRRKAPARPGLRYLVLRWFHSLVWLLLAIAVWLRGGSWDSEQTWAQAAALLALGLYVVFLGVSFTSKEQPTSRSD